jgi:glycosyltransferase involved in cell wall biosynthesis
MIHRVLRPLRYLLVVDLHIFPLADDRFSVESAFASHLRLLRSQLPPGSEIRICSPSMSAEDYAANRGQFVELGPEDGFRFRPVTKGRLSKAHRLLDNPSMLLRVLRDVQWADVVHGGPTQNLLCPFNIAALIFAQMLGKPTKSVSDMDEREQARMMFETGQWSHSTYWRAHHIYDPIRDLQLRYIARSCSLVLMKSQRMVDDYGRGRDAVHFFLNSAFSSANIISEPRLEWKLSDLLDAGRPLEVVAIGRLVPEKGVHHMVDAVREAVGRGSRVRLSFLGTGVEKERLERQVTELGLTEQVSFLDGVPFGAALFERLYGFHLLLAAPLNGDTPRSALDAMAAGLPVLSYDTDYYRTLSTDSGAVVLSPWNDRKKLGERLAELESDRAGIAERARAAVAYATQNTAEVWMERRRSWREAALFASLPPHPVRPVLGAFDQSSASTGSPRACDSSAAAMLNSKIAR